MYTFSLDNNRERVPWRDGDCCCKCTVFFLQARPIKNIGLFAKILPGGKTFSPTRQRKLSTFYFFANHMRVLIILAINYS